MTDKMKPSSIHSKKLHRFTRRRILKTLSAAGVSSAALGLLDVDTVRGAASDQIPISMDTEGNSTTYVEADWYDRLVKAREVFKTIENGFLPEQANPRAKMATKRIRDAVTGVWLDAGTGNSDPHIIVSVVEDAPGRGDAPGAIPEKMRGIPVEIEYTEREEETACSASSKSDTSEMPGGLQVDFYGPNDGYANGTLTSRVWNRDNYDTLLMTAAHVPENAVEDECGIELQGMDAYHNGTKIGEVDHVRHDHDVATIYPTDTTALDKVWNPGNHSQKFHVKDTMSADGIDTFVSNNEKIKKCGRTTCLTEGTVSARGKKERAYVNEECTEYWYDCVRWGGFTSIDAGDSGSLAFGADPNGDGYLATNINSWRWFDYSSGPAGYAIDNNHNYYWG